MSGNNTFKLYRNKNSLSRKNTRMLNGGDTETKGNKLGWWERNVLEKDPSSDIVLTINDLFHKRPDLVAFQYYRKASLFWLVLQYNNIVDVEEEFVRGAEIIIPNKARALTAFSDETPKTEPRQK